MAAPRPTRRLRASCQVMAPGLLRKPWKTAPQPGHRLPGRSGGEKADHQKGARQIQPASRTVLPNPDQSSEQGMICKFADRTSFPAAHSMIPDSFSAGDKVFRVSWRGSIKNEKKGPRTPQSVGCKETACLCCFETSGVVYRTRYPDHESTLRQGTGDLLPSLMQQSAPKGPLNRLRNGRHWEASGRPNRIQLLRRLVARLFRPYRRQKPISKKLARPDRANWQVSAKSCR